MIGQSRIKKQKRARAKKWYNVTLLAESAVLWLSSLTLFYLLFSKRYLLYVTEQSKIWLLLAAFVFLVWGLFSFRLRESFRHQRSASYLLVLLVPLFFWLIPHQPLGSQDLAGQRPEQLTVAADVGQTNETGTRNKLNDQRSDEQVLRRRENGEIEIDDRNYYAWIMEIYKSPKQYENEKLTVLGYISTEFKSSDEYDFAAFRPVMACCAADMMPLGLVCRNQTIVQPTNGQWYLISGYLRVGEREKRLVPYLEVTEMKLTDKPNPEYVTARY